jgi:hypothetical protein
MFYEVLMQKIFGKIIAYIIFQAAINSAAIFNPLSSKFDM